MVSDRQHVERILIPALMTTILTGIQNGMSVEHRVIIQPTIDLLTAAMREPLADVPADRADKIVRRSMRAVTAASSLNGADKCSIQWYAIARLTVILSDVIQIGQDSTFAMAWDKMTGELGLDSTLTEDDIVSGDELAGQMLLCLQSEGYFQSA